MQGTMKGYETLIDFGWGDRHSMLSGLVGVAIFLD
jgi:hypothetical protein